MLMNLKRCAACGKKFNLGEEVILACGPWDGPAQWIHPEDAALDPQSGTYVARQCVDAGS
jgi:hypothetical protein